MPTMTATDRFNLTEAVEYVERRLGIRISTRAFRSWVDKGYLPAFKNPGPRGHYYWSQALLDQIVRTMQAQPVRWRKGAKRKTAAAS